MPRNSDLFQYLDSVTKYVLVTATPGNTTTTELILGDGTESVVDVAAITNFTAADPAFIIGTGGYELVTLGTPATSMPVTRPLRVPQSLGAQLREAVAIPLGHIGPEGVSWNPSQSLTDIFAATARSAVSSLAQPASIAFSIPLRYKSGLDLQAAAGVPEAEAGSGVVATPHSVHVGQSNIGTQTPQCYRLRGRMESGAICELDLLGARLSVNFTDNRGGTDPGTLVIGGTITGASQFIWTP
jgi:hypothetical protein